MSGSAAATYILIALWPIDGALVEKQEAATTARTCAEAAHAAVADVGRPLYAQGPAAHAHCVPGNRFPQGWDCIATKRPTAEYHCR